MNKNYSEVIQFLESLQMMPKTMPGLQKIQKALQLTDWFSSIDPQKVIVVAGTNGKGSTCAMLEALLNEAGQKVGFYSSPHLVTTTERIRLNQKSISEADFVQLFTECEDLIICYELSHFEALTFMAGHYYFSKKWDLKLDYVILEVGLGGSFDATNAFPHRYSVITPIDFDHTAILGKSIVEIAQNKFGIVHFKNTVIYQKLTSEIEKVKNEVLYKTSSKGIAVEKSAVEVRQLNSYPHYFLRTAWGEVELSLKGKRAGENAMTALKVFETLGFNPTEHLQSLSRVGWPGRMQKVSWPGLRCPLYLSGDHNPQGIRSLLEILKDFKWRKLCLVIGIGVDKDSDEMLASLIQLHDIELYITETPFKGLKLTEYSQKYQDIAAGKNESVVHLISQISHKAAEDDMVVVTGSLYLVGKVLKHIAYQLR